MATKDFTEKLVDAIRRDDAKVNPDKKPHKGGNKKPSKGDSRAKKSKPEVPAPKEVRTGKKPGVYVHIIRLLMRASKARPLTDQDCYEALSKIKELKSRFATEEGRNGIWITMKDAYRRTLKTRMGWPVKEATDKAGKVLGWYLDKNAKSSDEYQQKKWERLNVPAKAK